MTSKRLDASLKYYFLRSFNKIARNLIAKTHAMEMNIVWGRQGNPPYFNHFYDLYYQWGSSSNFFWLERGIFNAFFIKNNSNVLEIACGDGFNTRFFYSRYAKKVHALDYSAEAIRHAKANNSCENIIYLHADVTNYEIKEKFENIIIDAALEQLESTEQILLLKKIRSSLGNDGVFSGLTICKNPDVNYLNQNKNEFDQQTLKAFLNSEFQHMIMIEKNHDGKIHLYFAVSNSVKLITKYGKIYSV